MEFGSSRENPLVNPVRRRLGNIINMAITTEDLRRVDHSALVIRRAAGNVNSRSLLQDDGGAGVQVDGAAVGRQFAYRALNQIHITGKIGEWTAHPGLAVESALLIDVDENRLTPQRAVPL